MESSLLDQVPHEDESAKESQDGRPEWLPEKYWDDESSQAKVKDVVHALAETQTALRNRKEELREEVLKELAENVPETPEAYKLDIEEMKLPAGVEAEKLTNDPEITLARQWAHDNKVPQEAFGKLISNMMKLRAETLPDPVKEMAKLGENAVQRVQRLDALATKSLDDEEQAIFRRYLTTAKGVVMVEKLLNEKRRNGPNEFDGTGHVEDLRARLNRLQSSPGYWSGTREFDPAIAQEAQKIIQQLENARK